MDGNGRWAQKRGLPRSAGHREGVKALRVVLRTCLELKVRYLTVYSFSSENWKRPTGEVNFLMDLFVESLSRYLGEMNKNGVRLRIIGDRDTIPGPTLKAFNNAEKITEKNERIFFNIALNYGSRQEILKSAKKLAGDLKDGNINPDDLDEKKFSNYLLTGDFPDPDLLIRTSGERRVSNFLLWQIAYTELYFTGTLWPDFGRNDLLKAVFDYQKRNRRFGKL
ncbi:MAG: isoprenyl transferase [Actinobacteria bacterium]|nr:isoprenyl transferase [Actinomycetota bacterium]